MSAKERKTLLRDAADARLREQRSSSKPVPEIEVFQARLLGLTAGTETVATVRAVDGPTLEASVDGATLRLQRPHHMDLVPGDRVVLEGKRIAHALPRRTWLARDHSSRPGEAETLVANVDLVLVVGAATTPPLRPGLIDRFVAAIADGRAAPWIVVNKVDGCHPERQNQLAARLRSYGDAGIPIHWVSAETGQGLAELGRELSARTSAVVGHSGVGKSSLVNALAETGLATGRTNVKTGKGRQTTTRNQLVDLPGGGWIADTAGIRAFGRESHPAAAFPEIGRLEVGCRFADCTHVREPGCAVREAVKSGALDRSRYVGYLRLLGAEEEGDSFRCERCGESVGVRSAGSAHRNHCPYCLWSRHLDDRPGDRRAGCGGAMAPVAVWVRDDGEWALVHRCVDCGTLHSNRIAADDNDALLLSLAAKPLASPPFPLDRIGRPLEGFG